MARIPLQDDEDGDANGPDDFRPLTAEEAQKLRLQQPLLSIWRVVLAQVVVGLIVAAFTWLLTGRVSAAWSAAKRLEPEATKQLKVIQIFERLFFIGGEEIR